MTSLLRNRREILLTTIVFVIIASLVSLIFGDSHTDVALIAADVGVVLVAVLWLRPGDTSARSAPGTTVPTSAVSDYVAVLAHELTSPIVSIGASAQVLAKELHGRTAETRALAIAEEARQMYALLESLLDLSTLESGRLRLSLRSVDIGALIRESSDTIDKPEHRLVTDVPAEPVVVTADDRRLRQVVRNLIDNAAKYSAAGTQIEMRVGVTQDHRSAIVQVRDHGPGIPPSERPRLFDKFVRLSTAGATRGSGLGLHLCKAIVTDHGGEIWAEFPAGGGMIISFTIPLAAVRTRQRVRQEADVT
jgi:signal transduction histidine kinase